MNATVRKTVLLISLPAAGLLYAQSSDANRVAPAIPTPSTTRPYSPITGKERFVQYLKDSINPMAFVSSGASAGIGQWRDKPKEWGEGGVGYEKRYVSSFSQHIVRTTLDSTFSAMLGEDNRYIPSHDPTTGSRIGYAVTSPFLTYKHDGSRRFAFSRIGAMAGASLISRLWQPRSTNKLRNAEINFGTSLGVTAGFDVVREFWPRRQ
jgi:hypothetical protein